MGSGGTGNGQLSTTKGVFVDGEGNVYVADYWNCRIQKFSGDGAFIAHGHKGDGDGQFNTPKGVVVDKDGYIYIADTSNSRMQKFQVQPAT